ncbi:MAG: glycerate kinase [Acidithiobacillus caldus]|nr:glycerate kinase [Acidithiobacillus caldus]
MRILIAPDHFKGSMRAHEVAEIVRASFVRYLPHAHCTPLPLADGGDGTMAVVVAALGGSFQTVRVRDPLGRLVQARMALVDCGRTAVLEMATASGLLRLSSAQRNPLETSTLGTGDLLRAALDLGVKRIVLGIGGSATNDGGMGMLCALGVRFLDAGGQELAPAGKHLAAIRKLDLSGLDPRLAHTQFEVICDVDNPLLGPQGATWVYGPQKGATTSMQALLEEGMRCYAGHLQRHCPRDVVHSPGAGAAGGLGAACIFLGARLRPGVEAIAELVDLEARIAASDLVITGEGCIDEQTLHGKTVAGVLRLARKHDKPTIVIAGRARIGREDWQNLGASALFTTLSDVLPEADIVATAAANLERTAASIAAVLGLCS